MAPKRIVPLDAGVDRGTLILVSFVLAPTLPIGGMLVAVSFMFGGVAGGLMFGLPLVAATAWLIVALISQFRYRVWLEGTTLVRQKAFWVQRCDLARANVLVQETTGPGGEVYRAAHGPAARVSSLTAWEPGTGRKLHVRLATDADRPLPGHQLAALADAIEAGGDAPIPRLEPLAEKAVATLRECAG